MYKPIGTILLMVSIASCVQAEELDEFSDPAASEEFAAITVGKANELFPGAAIDARIKGSMKDMRHSANAAPPPLQEIVVEAPRGGPNAGAVQVNICSPTVSDSARTIYNSCYTTGVNVRTER